MRRTRHACDRCIVLAKIDGRSIEPGAGRYRPLIDQWICGPCYPIALEEVAEKQRQDADGRVEERSVVHG